MPSSSSSSATAEAAKARKLAKYEAMLKHMVPGTTIEDLMSSSDDSDDDAAGGAGAPRQANRQGPATSLAKFQPAQHTHADPGVLRRILADDYYDDDAGVGGGSGGGGASRANQRVLSELHDATMPASRRVDRSERATTEGVMDPRTRLLLYKLVNSNILREVHGCVSTGKEANVYYAVAGDGSAAAVKIFKTSILVFKDRDQYVSGEFRFQRYCKSNPRKMVRTWAEKEARNLGRLQEGGVLAPAVRLLRQHILVMEFLGEDGWPAPRLKDVKFPSMTVIDACYLDLCCTMRKIYGRCRLIHGDLSEYNLLLYRGRVVVIDVSQSVESDHPRAMDFLRRDIVNVNAFFRSKGHPRLFPLQDLFHFITAPPAARGWQRCSGPDNSDEILEHLREMQQRVTAQQQDSTSAERAKVDEQVFLNIAVPRSLAELGERVTHNPEITPFVRGMMADSRDEADEGGDSERDEEEDEDEEGEEMGDGEEEEEGEEPQANGRKRRAYIPPEPTLASMTPEQRKEHKKAVKAANREKRAEKKKKNGGKKGKK